MKSIITEYSDRIEYENELGQYHRLDGPAIEINDGTKEWWLEWYLNGQRYSEEKWKQEVIKIKLKRILDL